MTDFDNYLGLRRIGAPKTSCKEAMANFVLRGIDNGKEKETITSKKE